MEQVRRFWGRLGKGLRVKGYTLIEVAAVVAVSATLAAVVVPIAVDKVEGGKLVGAKQDIQAIANGITGFNKDTGVWPAVTASSLKALDVLRSGIDSATGNIDTANTLSGTFDPNTASATGWNTGTVAGHLDGQLVMRPDNTVLTPSYNWKGPYIESFKKRDPWGNNYLVFVNAMHTASSGATKKYGWIISAGPNGKIETNTLDSDLKGDDIGLMLFSATATDRKSVV